MKRLTITALGFLFLMGACAPKQEKAKVIEKPNIDIKDGKFTPEVMWDLGKLGEYAVSPDNNLVAYTCTYYDVQENKGNAEIYVMNIDGTDVKRITTTPENEFNLEWTPDSKKLLYLKNTKTGPQMFEIGINGKGERQLSEVTGGMEGFKISPDRNKLYYIQTIAKERELDKLYEGLPKSTGRINEDLMYRHWDTWVDDYPHFFIANFNNGSVSDNSGAIDVLEGMPYECPVRPFGGTEQISWSPDGKTIAYTCKKKTGKEYAESTNTDIYLYDLESKNTINISEGMMGYDMNPVFSPDGKKIAWESMENDGYESDKNRLIIYDIETKTREDVSKDFDQNATGLVWEEDSKTIYFTSPWHGVIDIFSYDLDSKTFQRVTNGKHNINSIQLAGDKLIAYQTTMSMPAEIYSYTIADGAGVQISNINTEELNKITMGETEARWIKTTTGEEMLVWVIYPPHFDASKKYPTLLYCQGGPQDMISQFWSTRWNFQIMANAGYIVVAPNRHGVPGFGQKWNAQISGDYGGQCMKDYLTAIDEMAEEPFVDETRLGAVGASFGGYSIYWLAGHHNKRFKAFIAHNGMFNLEQQYLETEELFFANWDLGGPYWDKNNAVAQKTYANSPHKFVDKWDTPILVIHSELDYRIVASQGMAAYNAAVIRGIPARYLYFPDETHWVLKPQNSILWHRNFIDWLDKWLK
ncbi:S9 family peptidase [Bacteroidales bacterium OttesenSCG-928-C19]|nr:S9 family peptidase [Bacteroidales bacterium OttesenSCG-928-C19]